MGFRTLLVLNNDFTGDWSKNPHLGEMIAHSMNHAMGSGQDERARLDNPNYGRVLACQHADTQMIGVVSHFQFKPLAYSHWFSGQKDEEMQLQLLKEAADKLGFRLVKKPA